MNSTKWTNLIARAPQDEEIQRQYQQEIAEADYFLAKFEKATWKAAEYLNREFPGTPTETFVSALKSPDTVQFTSSHKKERFLSALAWRDSQC